MISATKYLKYVLFLTVIMLLSACSHPDSRLSDIDSYIESDPDSAYTALKAIDRASLSDEDFAYYALLHTQAQVKCGEILHSDSLLRHAYDRYSHQQDGDLKKRAHFYNSEIAFQNKDYPRAMRDALVAYEIAKSTDDHYWWAKSAEMISDIFYEVFNVTASLPYQIETVENYGKANRILNQRYAISDLAATYLALNRDTEALSLLDSLKNVVLKEQPLDTQLLNYINTNIPLAYYKNSKKNELEDIITQFSDSLKNDFNFLYLKGKIMVNEQMVDSACEILTCSQNIAQDERQSLKVKYLSYLNAFNTQDYRQAAILSDSILVIQNRIIRQIVNESVACAQRDFYTTKADTQEQISRNKSILLIIVAGFSCIIILMLIAIYRQKLRSRKAELEASASILLSLRKRLDEKNVTVDQLQQQIDVSRNIHQHNSSIIESLFREKWDTLNMLCNQYFEVETVERGRIAILNNIDKELKKLRTPKNLKEIETAVDTYLNGIISLLREQCPFLSEDDITLMALTYAGLSSRAVCLFMDIKYKLFYLRKNRIIKRIESCNAPDKDLFISKTKNNKL